MWMAVEFARWLLRRKPRASPRRTGAVPVEKPLGLVTLLEASEARCCNPEEIRKDVRRGKIPPGLVVTISEAARILYRSRLVIHRIIRHHHLSPVLVLDEIRYWRMDAIVAARTKGHPERVRAALLSESLSSHSVARPSGQSDQPGHPI